MLNINSRFYNQSEQESYDETENHATCECCGSKIYPGDTVYILEKQLFCEDCVDVIEYEPTLNANLY
jgi:hypothetical protein